MRVFIALSLCLPFFLPGASLFTEGDKSEVDAFGESLPAGGVVVALVSPDSMEFYSAGEVAGSAPDQIYEIGSITKAFTGLLLAAMIEEGTVSLDTPLSIFAERGFSIHPEMAAITLGQLVSDTSGLARLPPNFTTVLDDDPYAGYGAEEIRAALRDFGPESVPGEAASYSNFAQGLLGFLLTDLLGSSYERAILDRVLGSLNLVDTREVLSEKQKERLAPPFSGGELSENWTFDALSGTGSFRSTTREMARIIQAFLQDEVRPDFFARSLTSVHEDPFGPDLSSGWFVADLAEPAYFFRAGGTGGYRSFVAFSREAEPPRGVVMLSNNTEEVTQLGLSLLIGDTHSEDGSDQLLSPDLLQTYTGVFRLAPRMFFKVDQENGQLHAQLTGQARYPLFPVAGEEDAFAYRVVEAKLVFQVGADGKAEAVQLHQGGAIQQAPRVSPEEGKRFEMVSLTEETLAGYAGTYKLMGQDMVVERRGSILMVKLGAQPAYPVFPRAEDDFFYTVVEADLRFERDEAGEVTGLVLHQGGAKIPASKQ